MLMLLGISFLLDLFVCFFFAFRSRHGSTHTNKDLYFFFVVLRRAMRGQERDRDGYRVKESIRFLTARFVEAASSDVADPFDDVVIGIVQFGLKHFQIANFEARRSERHLIYQQFKFVTSIKIIYQREMHMYLKVHGDGWACPLLLGVGLQQLDFSRELRFFHTSHTFDPVNNQLQSNIELCHKN